MSSLVGRAVSVGVKNVTFRSLHFLHPESDFCTGRRLRLAGRAIATEPTDNGWPVWGAKSVDITVALRTQCHRKVVNRELMRVLSLLDVDRVECGAEWRLMYCCGNVNGTIWCQIPISVYPLHQRPAACRKHCH